MKKYNQVEVILFSKYSLSNLRHKELVTWLGTTLQPAISRQQSKAKKMFLKSIKESPAIYMS